MFDERDHPQRENLAAYALGALDAEDISAFEAHLVVCADCQAELADFRSVTSGLLENVPPQAPPPGLRRALIARLPSQQHRAARWYTNLFRRLSWWQAVSSLALLLLLGLNLFSNLQIRELQEQQVAMARRLYQDQTAIAMLAYPSTQALPVQSDVENVAGSMLVDKDKSVAVLVLWNLPEVEAGKTYQVWLIDPEGDRTSGGLFKPSSAQGYTTTTVYAPVPFEQFTGIGVTVEPEGGSPSPTNPRILGVDL
jgi:anti-sigma-K factor RskA